MCKNIRKKTAQCRLFVNTEESKNDKDLLH